MTADGVSDLFAVEKKKDEERFEEGGVSGQLNCPKPFKLSILTLIWLLRPFRDLQSPSSLRGPLFFGSSSSLHDGKRENFSDIPLSGMVLNGCESPKYQDLGSIQGVCHQELNLRRGGCAN